MKKVCVVTGGGSGIGFAAAKEAAKKATEEAVKKAMAEKKKTVEKLNDMGMDISLIASAVDMDEETIKQWLDK